MIRTFDGNKHVHRRHKYEYVHHIDKAPDQTVVCYTWALYNSNTIISYKFAIGNISYKLPHG